MSRSASEDITTSEFLYEEELVGVIFQKPLPSTKIGGLQMNAFVEGSEARLPRWAAKALEAEGVVKLMIEETQQLRSSELYKLCWKEERNETLSQLPLHFYPKLRDLIFTLNSSIKQNPTQTTLNEQRQIVMKAQDLINCRLQKILHLSFERNPAKTVIDTLEPEERGLFNALRSEMEDWRQKILAEEMK